MWPTSVLNAIWRDVVSDAAPGDVRLSSVQPLPEPDGSRGNCVAPVGVLYDHAREIRHHVTAAFVGAVALVTAIGVAVSLFSQRRSLATTSAKH